MHVCVEIENERRKDEGEVVLGEKLKQFDSNDVKSICNYLKILGVNVTLFPHSYCSSQQVI